MNLQERTLDVTTEGPVFSLCAEYDRRNRTFEGVQTGDPLNGDPKPPSHEPDPVDEDNRPPKLEGPKNTFGTMASGVNHGPMAE